MKQTYTVIIDLTVEKLELGLERESDKKWFNLKNFETWKIYTYNLPEKANHLKI